MKKVGSAGFAALLVLSTAAAPAKALERTELHFGSEPWHLELSLGDLKPTEGAESSPDRQIHTYADGRGSVLSVIVENAHEPANIDSCRDVFKRRKADIHPDNEVQSQRGDAATQEYDWKLDFQGKPIVQHNVYACRVRGTYYIDVHASKIQYLPADHDGLMRLIDAVTVVGLAAQAIPPQGFTPEEARAVAAAAECQKRYFDSIPPDDRRRRGEALIEESYTVCASEEARFQTILGSRFNAQATERVMQLVRDTGREQMLHYIKR